VIFHFIPGLKVARLIEARIIEVLLYMLVEVATAGGTDESGGAIILLNSSFTAVIITMFGT
jgi:predicted PP-loop superfamily ATPase